MKENEQITITATTLQSIFSSLIIKDGDIFIPVKGKEVLVGGKTFKFIEEQRADKPFEKLMMPGEERMPKIDDNILDIISTHSVDIWHGQKIGVILYGYVKENVIISDII